jgi:hypothetical protein
MMNEQQIIGRWIGAGAVVGLAYGVCLIVGHRWWDGDENNTTFYISKEETVVDPVSGRRQTTIVEVPDEGTHSELMWQKAHPFIPFGEAAYGGLAGGVAGILFCGWRRIRRNLSVRNSPVGPVPERRSGDCDPCEE